MLLFRGQNDHLTLEASDARCFYGHTEELLPHMAPTHLLVCPQMRGFSHIVQFYSSFMYLIRRARLSRASKSFLSPSVNDACAKISLYFDNLIWARVETPSLTVKRYYPTQLKLSGLLHLSLTLAQSALVPGPSSSPSSSLLIDSTSADLSTIVPPWFVAFPSTLLW